MAHVCPWWFAYTFDNPLRPFFHDPEKMFSEYVKEGMYVADIGCGLGYFSLGLARMVKENGKVFSVDLQPQMLKRLHKRAVRAGLSSIVEPQQCQENNVNIQEPLDFALAFWMVHEVPDQKLLFKQLFQVLKQSGILLFAEPKFHVSKRDFMREVTMAEEAGFRRINEPLVSWSYAAAFEKDA